MKILLIAPSYARDRNAMYFPTGIAQISSFIRQAGYQVAALNMGNLEYDERMGELEKQILMEDVDLVGISSMTLGFLQTEEIVRKIRSLAPEIPICLGGDITSGEPELVLRALQVDYGVVGEGELIFLNLLHALARHADVARVKGLWISRQDRFVFTGEGPLIDNLDELPLPDYELFGVENFFAIQPKANWQYLRSHDNSQVVMPVFASRSCPFNCSFCYHTGPYRQRSIPSLLKELFYFKDTFGITSFNIFDDLFATDRERIEEFCQALAEEGLDISWSTQMRVHPIDLEQLQMMQSAGCKDITFGIESGSDRILASMNKKINTRQIATAVELARQARIGVVGNFLYGDPAETEETLEESLQFQQENKMFFVQWAAIIPYPGSAIWKYVCKNKISSEAEKMALIRKLSNPVHYLWNDLVNMTTMTDKVFWDKFVALREVNDINFRKGQAVMHQSAPDKKRNHSRCDLECPSCGLRRELIIPYPVECFNGGEPDLNTAIGVKGINLVCPACRLEMHIPANKIAHVAEKYQFFQAQVQQCVATGEDVVLIPALDRFLHIFNEDIDLSQLHVIQVCDTREKRIGCYFMGKKVEELTPENLKKNRNATFFLLPWVEYEKPLSFLDDIGIRKVVCWNRLFADKVAE
ncbi:MAG: B12-binding domain-containing radical SAM protein [Deltaproteobacteria bacterium]|nr:B12-binding domain-containing radical SAM protein [Deltaproteobacteria bacterium]